MRCTRLANLTQVRNPPVFWAVQAVERTRALGSVASTPVDHGGIWHDQAWVRRQCLIAWSIRGTSSRKVTQTSS
jgi:hypothetical protein